MLDAAVCFPQFLYHDQMGGELFGSQETNDIKRVQWVVSFYAVDDLVIPDSANISLHQNHSDSAFLERSHLKNSWK